jgi:tetratricopeptide (TPR) repeat protein
MEEGRRRRPGWKGWITVGLVVLVLAGAVMLQYSIDAAGASGIRWNETSPVETAHSLLDILGGIRETVAAYFWTKTDIIHHQYYGGDVSREQALYPYYWMITELDPHFVMANYYASWMLCRMGQFDQGFELALEGIRHNPDSALLQENLASIYFFFEKEPYKARYHLVKAIKLTPDPGERETMYTFLSLIDKVISGEAEIPALSPIERAGEVHEHVHEEGEYCPECEHQREK